MAFKHIALGLTVALGLGAAAAPAAAQEGPKLYVFTSGSLGGFPKAALQMGGQGNIDWAPVSFYVLKHPKGNVIIDTGNNDKTITDPDGWWGPLAKGFGLKMTKDDAIPAQLAKIGLKTDDIKYVVVGHLHLDHGGNVGQFPNSTLVVQEDELKAAWWPDVGFSVYYIPGDFADTKKMNIIRLNGDLDLFDDGSVRIMRGPGHTPGSQFVVVKLPKTGSVILTSDVVYLKENLDKNLIPPIQGTVNPSDGYSCHFGCWREQTLRLGHGAQPTDARYPLRRGVRPVGTERLRQNHLHAAARGLPVAFRRAAHGSRPRYGPRFARSAAAYRLCAGISTSLSPDARRRIPRIHGPASGAARTGGRRRRGAGGRPARIGRCRGQADPSPVTRLSPAGGACPGTDPRSRYPHPRRADQRT